MSTAVRGDDPRVVGGRYRSGHRQSEYTVLDIAFDRNGRLLYITIQDADGARSHCTAWDPARDRICAGPPRAVEA